MSVSVCGVTAVLEITSEVPTKPAFLSSLRRTTLNEGDMIVLRVQAAGHPKPGFKWSVETLNRTKYL